MRTRRSRAPRGSSLIEAMVSLAIFAIAVVGTLQMMLIASQQNSTAGRMTYAGGIARQVRSTLQTQGRSALVAAGGLLAQPCATSDEAKKAAGDLATSGCVIDLDAYEGAAGKLFPAYPADDRDRYRRVVVYVADKSATPKVDVAHVVVSFRQSGQRVFSAQPVALYHVSANQAGVEL